MFRFSRVLYIDFRIRVWDSRIQFPVFIVLDFRICVFRFSFRVFVFCYLELCDLYMCCSISIVCLFGFHTFNLCFVHINSCVCAYIFYIYIYVYEFSRDVLIVLKNTYIFDLRDA